LADARFPMKTALTISKRFEFSSSRRYHRSNWSTDENNRLFGSVNSAQYGYGQNYTAHLVFAGEVDKDSGMLINIVEIKKTVNQILEDRYDHKFLNSDTKPFDKIIPTPENLAREILAEVMQKFGGHRAQPIVCHLTENPERAATAYLGGKVESHHWLEFSAARRTYSPHLSDDENQKLFGIASAPAGHGHSYRLRVTLGGEVGNLSGLVVGEPEVAKKLNDIYLRFDHRHLNHDIPELSDQPTTTEFLSRFFL